ncbi:hypothetical protein JNUCC0626_48515 [Lentzea sp. JNUCC 0626]|uniref:hypothetical protein n=1 Tax=Lentzea sp. JNUCC 0626 TaxID=3367513 RepID=UPI00374853C0
MTSSYQNKARFGDVDYQLSATAEANGLVLDLLGTKDSGEVVADGRLRLPVQGGGEIGKLISRVLTAHARLQTRPAQAAKANQPWSESLDGELRDAWMRTGDDGAAERIRVLAKDMERSATAIRARLPRVGCDPDVVARELSSVGAAIVGVQPLVDRGKASISD